MTPLTPGTAGFIEKLLADRIGLSVASVGPGLIQRGVELRMKHLGIRRQEDYERILLTPSDEIQALIEEVVIPESWFFRDDRPFATFRQFVRCGWVEQPHRRRLAVLCLPCASGEEPYSVAIALLELGLTQDRFEIVAIDVSVQSIQRATVGLYSRNAFRGMDLRLQEKYFIPRQGRYQLNPDVRTFVRFQQGNILDPHLMGEHLGFDVVFCRNLLIYFDDPARARAFANLDRLTQNDGLLFLGHADRSDQLVTTRFVPYADTGSFAYQKQALRAASGPAVGPVSAQERHATPKPRLAPVSVQPAPAVRLEPSPVPSPPPSVPPSRPRPPEPAPASATESDDILGRASTLADQGRYAEAIRLIRQRLGQGSLDAAAHFLLGIIYQAAGHWAEAETELTKAIYLNPAHDEALLAMALIARRKGDMASEAFYRRRADRVLARKGRS